MDEYTESNRVFWNARTAINANRYDVAGFKAGKCMLTPHVREELLPDSDPAANQRGIEYAWNYSKGAVQ
jgi:hypothetical protein